MEMDLERIIHDLYGNGRIGLIQEVTELKTKHKNMEQDLSSLAASYQKLARSTDEHLISEQARIELKQKMMYTWKFITIIISTAAVCTTLILKLI